MSTSARTRWTEITPARGLLRGFDIREVWHDRRVVSALVRREVKSSHKQSSIGVAWIVLRPLLGTVVFTAIFGGLAGLESDGLPYAIFALSGLLIWNFVSSAGQGAAGSIVGEAELVTKVYFPPILAPVAAALTPLVDVAVTVVALAVAMVIYGVAPSIAVLTFPLWVLAGLLFALGPGLWFCALNVRYRDAAPIFALLVQMWLFISPVVFASSTVDGAARTLLALNPMCGILDGTRWALVGGPAPPAVDLVGLPVGCLLLAGGFLYFVRAQRRFVDLV